MDSSPDSSDPEIAYERVFRQDIEQRIGFPKHVTNMNSEDEYTTDEERGTSKRNQENRNDSIQNLENMLPALNFLPRLSKQEKPNIYQDDSFERSRTPATNIRALRDKTNILQKEENPFMDNRRKPVSESKKSIVREMVDYFDDRSHQEIEFADNQKDKLPNSAPGVFIDNARQYSLPYILNPVHDFYGPPQSDLSNTNAVCSPTKFGSDQDVYSGFEISTERCPPQLVTSVPSHFSRREVASISDVASVNSSLIEERPVKSPFSAPVSADLLRPWQMTHSEYNNDYCALLIEKDQLECQHRSLLLEHRRVVSEKDQLAKIVELVNNERELELDRYRESRTFYSSLVQKHDSEFEVLADYIKEVFEDTTGLAIEDYKATSIKNNNSFHAQCTMMLNTLQVAMKTKERMTAKKHASDIQMLRRRMEQMGAGITELKLQHKSANKLLERTYSSLLEILGGNIYVSQLQKPLTSEEVLNKIQSGNLKDAKWIHNGVFEALRQKLT
ncbi:hypothetical protein OGAPHI_000371 [Ogataea philodendri]|uniref:Uncharacterized protein n=1 Tax=Ogataea philodendri TaxID=1378263 RepID=A0A9P8PGU1_9ASCO|nr:uncharacterized protein OGAPHI_000371 [Ogataea philodendri]KAH3671666.1 hypothetical protein OGAPHI_000371 [Ogataea philodendri]